MLCGVEAHVCVHATTVDFISRGFQASNDDFDDFDDVDDDGELVRGGKRVTTRKLRLTVPRKNEVMH